VARPNTAETLLKLVGLVAACAVLCAGVLLPYVGGLGLVAGREARALILLGRVAPGLLSDLESLLHQQELKLLGRLQTPVSAVLMRGLLDSYLQAAAHPAGA